MPLHISFIPEGRPNGTGPERVAPGDAVAFAETTPLGRNQVVAECAPNDGYGMIYDLGDVDTIVGGVARLDWSLLTPDRLRAVVDLSSRRELDVVSSAQVAGKLIVEHFVEN